MTQRKRFSLTLVLVGTLVVAVLFRRAPSEAQDAAGHGAVNTAKPMLLGNASCAASVCHGGAVIGAPGSEAMTWRALDPHARAYASLLTDPAKAMAKALWGDKTAAHEAALCLQCHVHPEYDHARPHFRRADGVGCEACHGAAQEWVGRHYFKSKDKQLLGLADTKSLQGRAEICAPCHVGTPRASVDHDLIAAGHPPLRFEFATYLANLPPHWDVAKDRKAKEFEARAWAIGQEVCAKAAGALRAHRADPARSKPGPELAEFDCFACHHQLADAKWKTDLKGRRPGSMAPSKWYFAMEPDLKRAERTSVGWESALLEAIAGREPHGSSWDEATQHLLALEAARQLRKDQARAPDAALDRRAEELHRALAFPPGFASPMRQAK